MDARQEVEGIRQLLEDGQLEPALSRAGRLARSCPEDPEVWLCLADAWWAAGEATGCREAAEEALRLCDPEVPEQAALGNEALYLLAWSSWQLWELKEAESMLRRLLAADPDDAEAWDLLAAILEQTGRWSEAETAVARAVEFDPESFSIPLKLSDQEVEDAIQEGLKQLPDALLAAAREVPVVIQDFPSPEMAVAAPGEQPMAPDTLGLFVGTSLAERSHFSALETPGTIFLFKRNLERICPDRESLIEEITTTLHHELAHYLGFEEESMPDLGLE